MTCTAKSEMSLDEHLVNAEDCVKFDELYFKPLGKKTGKTQHFLVSMIEHLHFPGCPSYIQLL